MGIYRTVCYKVEDVFVSLLTRKQKNEEVKFKVESFRKQKIENKKLKKELRKTKAEELKIENEKKRAVKEREKLEKAQLEKQQIEKILTQVVDTSEMPYTTYEYEQVKRNKHFFFELPKRVFEPNEKGLTFLSCEFDKSSKREIRGFLIVTNKRVLFINKDFTFLDKFRYQTINNVTWFKDGIFERGLHIQYGKKRLEFDEIYDNDQMQRVGNLILNLSRSFSMR